MTKLLAVTSIAAALVLAACRDAGSPAVAPAFDVGGGQSGMNLHPSGFGEQSYAAWKAHQGEPDAKGNADQALYFQKMTATATFAAGVAVIDGLEGQPASALTALSWDHRTDGWCGAGAPRWNVGLTDATGDHTVFLGCNAATHTVIDANWTTDSYTGADIAAAIAAAGVDPAATIRSLAIVFDEGTDIDGNPGFVFLDNITVNSTVWSSPADNSN